MNTVQRSPLQPDRPLAFSVTRVPFFLEPDYDESEAFTETNRTRLVRKWGGQAGWMAQKARHDLKGRAARAGITDRINLDRLASSTKQSHRVVQYVTKKYGLAAAEALYDALNWTHFVDGNALNNAEMLVSRAPPPPLLPPQQQLTFPSPKAALAAQHSGADEVEVLAFLAGDEGRAEIDAAQKLLRTYGIHSIPKFVVNGQHVIDGAAVAEDHVDLFRRIEADGEVGEPIFAHALGIPDEVFDTPSHPAAE